EASRHAPLIGLRLPLGDQLVRQAAARGDVSAHQRLLLLDGLGRSQDADLVTLQHEDHLVAHLQPELPPIGRRDDDPATQADPCLHLHCVPLRRDLTTIGDTRHPSSQPAGGATAPFQSRRTYSWSKGSPLMPRAGFAIQLAIWPGSLTCFWSTATYSRSLPVGSHSSLRFSHSSRESKRPSTSKGMSA